MKLLELTGTQHHEEDDALRPEVIEALWRMEDHHSGVIVATGRGRETSHFSGGPVCWR